MMESYWGNAQSWSDSGSFECRLNAKLVTSGLTLDSLILTGFQKMCVLWGEVSEKFK